MYDSVGTLRRTVGRRGAGPGELQSSVGQIVARVDGGFAVFQPGRLHLFDSSFAFQRAIAIPVSSVPPTAIAVDANTFWIAAAWRRTREAPGSNQLSRLHVLSVTNGARQSVDAAPRSSDVQRRCQACASRHLSIGANGDVWSAHHYAYVVQRWSRSGQLRETWSMPNSAWFPADIGQKLESATISANATTPVILGVWQGDDSTLFVLGSASSTTRIREETAKQRGVVSAEEGERESRRVTMIDAIDLRRGAIMASARMEAPPYFRTEGDGLLYTRNEDADGVIRVTVWRAVISYP